MFCPECGSVNEEGSKFCDNCGKEIKYNQNKGQSISRVPNNALQGSALAGFFKLIAIFFTMPIKTIKLTISELREIGGGSKFDVDSTEIPHLTWLSIAGHLIAAILIFIIILIGIGSGIKNLGNEYQSLSGKVGYLFLGPIGGIFAALVANWIVMIFLEFLTISIGIANNVRKIAQN